MLGTPGGTVDLRTGELRDSRREDAITKLTAVAPLDDECPLWLKFLDDATGGDHEFIRFLQQWCGYCLTGVTREHALVFVYGPGGNGKSVFLNIVRRIFDHYVKTAPIDTFTSSHSKSTRPTWRCSGGLVSLPHQKQNSDKSMGRGSHQAVDRWRHYLGAVHEAGFL